MALPLGGLGARRGDAHRLLLAGELTGPITLILAGVAVSSLAAALTSLALNLAPNPFAASEMLYWLMGSLTDRSLVHVWLAAPLMVAGALPALNRSRSRCADARRGGGAEPRRRSRSLRNRVIAGTALAVGAATSVAGAIGFVGLVVPHLLRPSSDRSRAGLLLPSFLGGAALVLIADVALRLMSPAGDLRLGVVTALIGAPFFLWLVLKTRREMGP